MLLFASICTQNIPYSANSLKSADNIAMFTSKYSATSKHLRCLFNCCRLSDWNIGPSVASFHRYDERCLWFVPCPFFNQQIVHCQMVLSIFGETIISNHSLHMSLCFGRQDNALNTIFVVYPLWAAPDRIIFPIMIFGKALVVTMSNRLDCSPLLSSGLSRVVPTSGTQYCFS